MEPGQQLIQNFNILKATNLLKFKKIAYLRHITLTDNGYVLTFTISLNPIFMTRINCFFHIYKTLT